MIISSDGDKFAFSPDPHLELPSLTDNSILSGFTRSSSSEYHAYHFDWITDEEVDSPGNQDNLNEAFHLPADNSDNYSLDSNVFAEVSDPEGSDASKFETNLLIISITCLVAWDAIDSNNSYSSSSFVWAERRNPDGQ